MTISILRALDDPKLFGPHFRGATWAPWKAFLAALFGLALSDAQLVLYRNHTGRLTAPVAAFVEACLVIGRRGGKSRVLALIAVYLACFRDYKPHLAPGERATIAVIAADRRQARVCMRFIIGMLDSIPMLRALRTDETAETVSLSNRVTIEVHTASFASHAVTRSPQCSPTRRLFGELRTQPTRTLRSSALSDPGSAPSLARCC